MLFDISSAPEVVLFAAVVSPTVPTQTVFKNTLTVPLSPGPTCWIFKVVIVLSVFLEYDCPAVAIPVDV